MAAEFAIERIYVKDLSFESPRAPEVFRAPWQPKDVRLDINSGVTALGDDRFEVVLTVTLTIRDADAATNAIIEVQQAGLFRVRGLPDDQRARLLGTMCPNVLFPYVRETVDALMLKGGFPALALAPVNFETLYDDEMKRRAARKNPEAGARSPKGGTEH